MLVSDDPDAGKEGGGLTPTQVIPPPAMIAPPIPKENARKSKEK